MLSVWDGVYTGCEQAGARTARSIENTARIAMALRSRGMWNQAPLTGARSRRIGTRPALEAVPENPSRYAGEQKPGSLSPEDDRCDSGGSFWKANAFPKAGDAEPAQCGFSELGFVLIR